MSIIKSQITLLLLVFVSTLFIACEKDINSDQDLNADLDSATELELRDDVEEPHGGPLGALGRSRCLKLIFPLTVDLPDGTSAEVADRQELHDLITNWKENNPDAEERPRIAFPHDIELPDGTIVTVNSPEQLRNFIRRCEGRPMPHPCFQLVFPLTVELPDGSKFEAATRKALAEFVHAWREANPGVEGRPEIVKPYQVRLRNGRLATVAEEGDLAALVADCRGDRPQPDPELCFKLVYPATLVFPDGTTATAESRQEMSVLIEAWRRANPEAAERPAIAFPQQIELSDGEVVEVQNREEMEALLGDCWEDRPFDLPCFRLVFPLDVVLPDGTTKTAENAYQFGRLIRVWRHHDRNSREHPELAYPIEITYEDGSTVQINSREELKAAKENCQD